MTKTNNMFKDIIGQFFKALSWFRTLLNALTRLTTPQRRFLLEGENASRRSMHPEFCTWSNMLPHRDGVEIVSEKVLPVLNTRYPSDNDCENLSLRWASSETCGVAHLKRAMTVSPSRFPCFQKEERYGYLLR